MSNRRLYVVDTNILISALIFPKSIPARAIEKAERAGRLAQSLDTLFEFIEVSNRRKFDKYLTLTERERFTRQLTRQARMIIVRVQITACRDPKDNKFLELAVSAKVAAIITGDEDLLILNPFEKIPILTPQAFLAEDVDKDAE